MKAFFCAALILEAVDALNADEIPRVRTPEPGAWPQNGVTGCGILGLPQTDMLDTCDEPLHSDAPDLTGFWMADGKVHEFIAMCGMRWIDVSLPVIHDHPRCDGTLQGGVEDYSGPDIVNAEDTNNDVRCRGLCATITTAGKFETDADGNKCVVLYTDIFGLGFLNKVVSRCLYPDGSMMWAHPIVGTVYYTKVPAGEEPNCVTCPDGETSMDPSQRLSCSYHERNWTRCSNTTEGSSAPEPEQVDFCKNTIERPNGPLILTIALLVLALVCGLGIWACACRTPATAEKDAHVELTSEAAS